MANLSDDPLLYPPKELPAWAVMVIDISSWAFPVFAAALSIWGGIEALNHADHSAAWFGIAGGVMGALGVAFTNWASRIRDTRLKIAHALGESGFSMAAEALANGPGTF